MLRIHASTCSKAAAEYFKSLATEDYYSKGEVKGRWGGEAAKKLGLDGDVSSEQFSFLVHNRHPETGEKLTLRDNKTNRRAGYDFTFNAPKSLSVAYLLTGDKRLLDAWQDTVRETMQEIEQEAKARVRKNGQQSNRVTGNLAWAEFTHLTARPEGGYPDPHLHTHAYVANCTYDHEEKAWKAVEIGDIKRDAPYFEALFHMKLADRLSREGYAVERTKTGWELADVPSRLREEFSRRTAAIEKVAKEKGITDADQKAALGAKTREMKNDLSPKQLREIWVSRLQAGEKEALARIKPKAAEQRATGRDGTHGRKVAAEKAVDFSLRDTLERSSVTGERELLRQAMKQGVGKTGVEETRQALQSRGDVIIRDYEGRRLLTTREVLREEQKMVAWARQSRGSFAPFVDSRLLREPGSKIIRDPKLSAEQRATVEHLLTSNDQVLMVRGKAGVGKTRSLRSAADVIQEKGYRIHAVAPSAEASRRVLREAGFNEAETVARLLQNEELQSRIGRGDVILVDEAGQLGNRDMLRLFQLAEKQRARVLLVGDDKQHGSVPRGNALTLLEQQSGIMPSEIKTIRRQQGVYRQAVEALSVGDTGSAFKKLDELKAIREINDEGERYRTAAKDYVGLTRKGQEVLVIAPTHHEGRKVSDQIRSELRDQGMIGTSEREFTTLQNLGLTEAKKADPLSYREGHVVQFRQNVPGFRIGHRARVLGLDAQGGVLVNDSKGQAVTLPFDRAKDFEVYDTGSVSLASGDRIRFTQNGFTKDKKRLNNGAVCRVDGFTDQGSIRLENGWVVDKDFGHFRHGYVSTSYSSQSRTTDAVLIVQGRESAPAASQAQAYVSVSRGKSTVRIYTDDRQALEDAMARGDRRMSASELVGERTHLQRRSRLRRREERTYLQPAREEQARIPERERSERERGGR